MKFRNFMWLQFFADGDGAGADGNGTGTDGEGVQGDNGQVQEPSGSAFEDFLKDGKNQAEFDRRVNKAIDTALGNAKEKWKKEADDQAAEAAKLAKMNAEQKQQYELEKLQRENQELRDAATKVELERAAAGLLGEHGIDATQETLGFVVGKNGDDTKDRVGILVKLVESQLGKAEIARAKGITPKVITNDGNRLSEIDKRIAKYK